MMFWSALKAARLYVKPKDNGPVPKEWLRKTTLQAICGKWKVVMHYVCGDGAEWVERLKFHSLLRKLIAVFTERWPFRCIYWQVVADLQHHEKCMEESHQQNIKILKNHLYHLESRWRNSHVLVYHGPTKPPFGSCAIYFHHGVRKVDTLLQAPFGDFGQILRIDVSESGWPMLKIRRGELMFKPCWRIGRCL